MSSICAFLRSSVSLTSDFNRSCNSEMKNMKKVQFKIKYKNTNFTNTFQIKNGCFRTWMKLKKPPVKCKKNFRGITI